MEISNELFAIMDRYAADACISFRTNYSGRGMYRRQCIGFDGSQQEIMRLLGDITRECHDIEINDPDAEGIFDEWMDFAFDFSQDSMGLGTIIYWPNVEAPEGAEATCEDYEEDED